MPSEKEPFYDPVPPTYDEAVASGSRRGAAWGASRSSIDERQASELESRSLLQRPGGPSGSSRRAGDYQQPTVETDDEDSLWDSDTDLGDGEAEQVRREMQEMDIEEPSSSRTRIWGKPMGLLSLQNWRWKWSWMPRLPRLRIQLPQRPSDTQASNETDQDEPAAQVRRWGFGNVKTLATVVMFARALVVIIILGFLYLLFTGEIFGSFSNLNAGFRFNPEDLRHHIQASIDPARMRDSVRHFTSYAHIAGTEGDYATAMDVESMFSKAGLDEVSMDDYYVYINYPRKDGRAVEILDEKGEKAVWTAKLEEEEAGGAETAGRQTYAFHGHSKSGTVTGPLIYANYGSREEYQKLKDMGIKTEGAIALVRYYGTQTDRALKVKGAELAGFAGCIIYSDPQDDGFLVAEEAPNGLGMPSDGVQRGAVSLMSWVVGDVLTPGWESKEGLPRMKVNDTAGLNHIPSLPLAWRDAQVLLQHLKGHGQQVPDGWKGGVPTIEEWWTGDESSPIVRLKNEQDENEEQPIWNVYGKIVGVEQSAKSVILGNHRDAWAFGATDPHTGTAVLIEMARVFGDLVSRGWRPLRTIEFMSWDAEEYNLIGSTEFVEANLDSLRKNGIAYINLDVAVSGNKLRAAGSPVFRKAVSRALGRVDDPFQNKTLQQLWDEHGSDLQGLGAGSDYVAFQDIAGTSSLDLTFEGSVHPYHSSYDNFDLMDQHTDPGFVYHGLMAQVVGLIILDLADRAILPLDMPAYGRSLQTWVFDLEKWALDHGSPGDGSVPFDQLKDAAQMVKDKAETFQRWEFMWDQSVMGSGGWETNEIGEARLLYNEKMTAFETALLDLEMGGGVSIGAR